VQLTRDPTVVATARRHAVDACREQLDESRCEDLALAVSELVTNAIRYGREPVTLAVRQVGARVRVEVTDANPTPPAVVDTATEQLATGRRGLTLVAGLCRRWGWEPSGEGKRVWCEI
jgi:anti-sigma regulatory factor (Ser/Thr protein kinase)